MGGENSKLLTEFKIVKILGHGAFGVVLKAQHKFDEVSYAVKLTKLPTTDDELVKAMREARHFASLPSHQNIVCYKTSWKDTLQRKDITAIQKKLDLSALSDSLNLFKASTSLDILCIQMELCGKTLGSYLQECISNAASGWKIYVPATKHLSIFFQITSGLQHIHKHNLIHRDLKPDNIFFSGSDTNVVKIGDLGTSRRANDNNNYKMTAIGTISYMPFEQFSTNYGKEVDLYSLGLILIELLCPHPPNQLIKMLFTVLLYEKLPENFESNVSSELILLAKALTSREPEKRPNFDKIFEILYSVEGKEWNFASCSNSSTKT